MNAYLIIREGSKWADVVRLVPGESVTPPGVNSYKLKVPRGKGESFQRAYAAMPDSEKIASVMAKQEDQFVAGCVANGHPEALGRELFGYIEHFAGYGFNKSHSAAYGLVA